MYYFDTIIIFFQCFCCCSEDPKSQAATAPMSKLQSVWECCIDGTWSAYESSDNAKIDVHFRQSPNTQLRTQFSFSPTTVYIIDFDTMSQINTSTQAKRPIRWKPAGYPACWECKIDGRWVSYNAKDAMTISTQFEKSPNSSAPVALSFNNEQYTIDFGRMVQINRATKAQRPIRARPASAPAPALSPAPTAPGAPAQDLAALRAVVEHLFSDASLAHDAYLHGRLAQAPGGWLRIDDILHFRRMLALSATASSVQQAVRGSAVVETQVPAARPVPATQIHTPSLPPPASPPATLLCPCGYPINWCPRTQSRPPPPLLCLGVCHSCLALSPPRSAQTVRHPCRRAP